MSEVGTGPSRLRVNGVNAVTGDYLLPEIELEDVGNLARGRPVDIAHLRELEWLQHRATERFLGTIEGVDATDLGQAGWSVVFAADADPSVREALGELLALRKDQAGRVDERFYREYGGDDGYRASETKGDFLVRHGAAPGQPADPRRVPYYVLLIGGPEEIPFSFQHQMDVQYAVGRLHFETVEEYANYARTVVASESDKVPAEPRAAFFGTRNDDDRATALSAAELVAPLAEMFATAHPQWTVERMLGDTATKARLAEMLGGAATPALLFTATHGAGFPDGHQLQRRRQGGLICQEWPGPRKWRGALSEDHYLHGEDITEDADLRGVIAFHFACFGAGTPDFDDFTPAAPGRLAKQPFVAGLPRRLLGHARRGALAVIGHVDRAWGYSFVWPNAGRQTEVFRGCLAQLARGLPIGAAFESFNVRYADLASDLALVLQRARQGLDPDDDELAFLWTANNDARDLVILGDPAVRCMTTPKPLVDERPSRSVVVTPAVQSRPARAPAARPPPEPAPGGMAARAQLDESLRSVTRALGRLAEDLTAVGAMPRAEELLAKARSAIAALAQTIEGDHAP